MSRTFLRIRKSCFFHAIDNCKWTKYSPTKCYVVPMIFRMIYCCGLRSSEARKLYREDVDLEAGKVLIWLSKFWQERIIYVSWDLLENIRECNTIINRGIPNRAAFFPDRKGQFFSTQQDADINSLRLYLSEYAGHVHYGADDYYQHLTMSFYPKMEKHMGAINKNILPEVFNER